MTKAKPLTSQPTLKKLPITSSASSLASPQAALPQALPLNATVASPIPTESQITVGHPVTSNRLKVIANEHQLNLQPSLNEKPDTISSNTRQTRFRLIPIKPLAISPVRQSSLLADKMLINSQETSNDEASQVSMSSHDSQPEHLSSSGGCPATATATATAATATAKLNQSQLVQPISDTNLDFDDKIRNEIKPSHHDKKRLQSRIKQLDKKQQLHLFHTIIKPLNIYKVTNTGTFFDLNELTPKQFWELSYDINLTYDCINRDKILREYEREYTNLYQLDSDRIVTNVNEPDLLMDLNQLPTFQQFNRKQPETKNFNEYESKVLERNVYTDKRRQKPENKVTKTTRPKSTKATT